MAGSSRKAIPTSRVFDWKARLLSGGLRLPTRFSKSASGCDGARTPLTSNTRWSEEGDLFASRSRHLSTTATFIRERMLVAVVDKSLERAANKTPSSHQREIG